MDPFHAFTSYPTRTLTEKTVLAWVDAVEDTALKRTRADQRLAMIDFAKVIQPSEVEIGAELQAAAAGPSCAAWRGGCSWACCGCFDGKDGNA